MSLNKTKQKIIFISILSSIDSVGKLSKIISHLSYQKYEKKPTNFELEVLHEEAIYQYRKIAMFYV